MKLLNLNRFLMVIILLYGDNFLYFLLSNLITEFFHLLDIYGQALSSFHMDFHERDEILLNVKDMQSHQLIQ